MNDLAPVLICSIMAFAVYRILELYARRKERMAMIEKLQFSNEQLKFNLPLFNSAKLPSTWALRASLLLIGIGLGLIVAFVLESTLFYKALLPEFSDYDWNVQRNINNTVTMVYLACLSVFGGLGLFIAYNLEQKREKQIVDKVE